METKNNSIIKLTLAEAKIQTRELGYSLQKINGEFIARPLNAPRDDDSRTVYTNDLSDCIASVRLDAEKAFIKLSQFTPSDSDVNKNKE